MANCVRNIPAKNYRNLIIRFQVTVENVGDVFWDTVYYNAMNRTWRRVHCASVVSLFETITSSVVNVVLLITPRAVPQTRRHRLQSAAPISPTVLRTRMQSRGLNAGQK